MEAMGIIFSNIYDNIMGKLTEERTSAAIPFGGRYRQIDFALSSMSHALIRHICVITKYNYESLLNHIGSCEEWDLELETDGLVLLPPYATGHTGVYRGKLEALYTIMNVLEQSHQEYVVLSDTTVLAAVDYSAALEDHIRSGCDVTVIASAGAKKPRRQTLAVWTDETGRPRDMAVDVEAADAELSGMSMYIISRKRLMEILNATAPHGKYHLERDMILAGFVDGSLSVNVWQFPGTALFNVTMQEYYENSMALLDPQVRKGLFHSRIPIYTKPRNEVPTFYGKNARVERCMVADGCSLSGSCRNSVVFREAVVEENAQVADSIVMQGCHIGTGASLQYVLLDKDVNVKPYTKLQGSPENPLYITKGATV